MHIPPYYKKPSWQAFFIGVLVGVVIGYLFFLYLYGEHTERWIEENLTLEKELKEVNKEYELLKKDTDQLSEENQKKLTIQDVEVKLLNAKQLKLDRFTTLHLTDLIEDEIGTVMGQNIESVHGQRELLKRTLENKIFKVNNITYNVEIVELTIYTTLYVSVNIKIQSS
ncbi:sporulation membrane protein YtrI [Filobacillus milosensis]|nr:sporulation membrane protein YtrI [Filobacillus milosensis]